MTSKPAHACNDMSEVRAEIDRLDAALVDLIAERFSYVDRAWQVKSQSGSDGALVPWRIQEVIDRVKDRAETRGLPPELAEALWRQMIGWFVQYEEQRMGKSGDKPQTQPGASAGTASGTGGTEA